MSERARDQDPSTRELRLKKAEEATGEHEAIEGATTPDEAHQHSRRADKAAYLERKLAERERSEREAEE
jgi:hypothetical protein